MKKPHRSFSLTIIAILFLLLFTGCQGKGNPVCPDGGITVDPAIADLPPTGHHVVGIFSLDFDPVTETASAIQVRSADLHFDVTQFFMAPYCTDCISISVTEYDAQTGIFDIDVTLTNATPVSGWDIRVILREDSEHIWLADHDDDYTALFDDGGAKVINPFIAYAKDQTERIFGSLKSHTRPIHFRFDELGHWTELTFVIEASYPDNCEEPYEIANVAVSGQLIGSNPATIECDVFDWQNNVSQVLMYPSPLADDEIALNHDSGTHWSGLLVNENEMPQGSYSVLIRGISVGGNLTDSVYDYIDVTVGDPTSAGLDPGPWPMIGQNPTHSARSPYQAPLTEPGLEWSSADYGVSWIIGYSGAVVSSSGRIYVARISGIYCLDSTGEPVWDTPPPFDNPRQPPEPLLTANGKVIVCWSSQLSNDDPQGIYAYDVNDGSEDWSKTSIKYTPSGSPKHFSAYDSPVINGDGLLVAVAREHVIVALDANDGSQEWLWPSNESEYKSIAAGSYTDGWRSAPALASNGNFVAVADWFETPRLVVLTDYGSALVDKDLKTITTVNCHPAVTSDNKIILAGFAYDVVSTKAVVEAWTINGSFLWDYTDDVIEILQGTVGIDDHDNLFFMDGRGMHDADYPNDYHVYLLSLTENGTYRWRTKILTRPAVSSPTLSHFRDGVAVGVDGTVYVAGSWNHMVIANTNVSGICAVDNDGEVLWTYNELIDVAPNETYYGPPAIGDDGTIYVSRATYLEALK